MRFVLRSKPPRPRFLKFVKINIFQVLDRKKRNFFSGCKCEVNPSFLEVQKSELIRYYSIKQVFSSLRALSLKIEKKRREYFVQIFIHDEEPLSFPGAKVKTCPALLLSHQARFQSHIKNPHIFLRCKHVYLPPFSPLSTTVHPYQVSRTSCTSVLSPSLLFPHSKFYTPSYNINVNAFLSSRPGVLQYALIRRCSYSGNTFIINPPPTLKSKSIFLTQI